MILKIKSDNEYVLFDNLRRVSIPRGIQESAQWDPKRGWLCAENDGHEDPWCEFKPTYVFYDTRKHPGKGVISLKMVRAVRRDGGEPVSFVFGEAFLLSDEGTTIEVIR